MEPRINIVTLGVLDVARALRFYRDWLGWKPALDLGSSRLVPCDDAAAKRSQAGDALDAAARGRGVPGRAPAMTGAPHSRASGCQDEQPLAFVAAVGDLLSACVCATCRSSAR